MLDAKKYLCLNGIIINDSNYNNIEKEWHEIRKLFTNKKTGIIPSLHYQELARKSGAFYLLQNPIIEQEFNKMYLDFLSKIDMTIIAVTIDKSKHLDRHQNKAHDPYHASLKILLDRYYYFLSNKGAIGKVIAESRKQPNDLKLSEACYDYWCNGGYNQSNILTSGIQKHINKNISFHVKTDMIAGLEISDMLATIMKRFTLEQYGIGSLPNNFGKKVINIAKTKIRKNNSGKIKGWGILLYP